MNVLMTMRLSIYQAGFRPHVSTTHQVFRFIMLYWNTVVLGGGTLYAAFIDLKSAFDLVPRNKLWNTLNKARMPAEILSFIIKLHDATFAQVRWGLQGETTEHFLVNKGVWQGCVLAPTLFFPVY